MDLFAIGAAALGGLAVLTILLAVRSAVSVERDEVIDRVQRVTAAAAATPATRGRAPDGGLLATVLRPLSKLAKPGEGEDLSRVRTRLVHAGFRGDHAVESFFGAKLALGIAFAGGLLLISGLRPTAIADIEIISVLAAAVGFYAPNYWLARRVTTRQTAISKALPDTLDLMITCIEAGLSIEAALQRIQAEIGLSAPELSSELQHTMLEIQAGMTRAEAFRRLAERTGLEDLRALSAMLIQTEMFGTSIAKSLRVHSAGMRIRRTHRAEERGATVAVKMLMPLILCILPSLFAVILGPAVVRIVETLMPTLAGGQ